MTPLDKGEDPRRRWLVQALTAGLFLQSGPIGSASAQTLLGSRPGPLPPGRSIYRLSGSVRVNGREASLETVIKPGDTVETGPGSEVIFVMGAHSMILRARSKMTVQGESNSSGTVLTAMNLAAGKILSVSRNARTSIATPTAAIVIRGTGWYVESDPEQTYFCTCYGTTEVAAVNDARSREIIVSAHHDRPIYVLGQASSGQSIQDAPFLNHTDQELALIEALVGRLQPNVFPKDSYGGPRRSY